jgi:uncharacterized protein (TIGR02145 family)
MIRILLVLMVPFVCLGQKIPREGNPINNEMNKPGNVEIDRKTSFNLEEIKVRWKKAALENCPGVPCVVTPPPPSFTCGTSTVKDVDGNDYNTTLIGTQCWTTTNLKVTKYNDGTLIGDSTNSTWGKAMIGARTGYVATGVTASYVGTFGYLYNWYAVNDSRKLCPAGWHVPTDAEWTIMIQTLDPSQVVNSTNVSTFNGIQSNSAGTVMKSAVTNTSLGSGLGWDPGSPGTNTRDFSGLPGGYRNNGGSFLDIRKFAVFWSATEYNSNSAMTRYLFFNNGYVYRQYYVKTLGASVRCLRD